MATPISRDVLNKETNARFWAQTGYKVGQRLDPKNPADKPYTKVWMDVFRKVKAEADAGTLVTTYDHPAVAQSLSDAQVANTVAAAHVDAAAKATDPWDVQTNTAAATTAVQVANQKAREAAANQPPTVSPELEQKAAREAAKAAPPAHAPAAEHIAHAQTQTPKPPQPPAPPRDVLYRETNQRFWNRTNYKRDQKLDMSDPTDRQMAKVWMDIFHEVQREANEGRLTLTAPETPSRPPILTAPPPYARPPAPMPTPPPQVQPQPRPPIPAPWPMPGLPRPAMPSMPAMPMPSARPGMPVRPSMPMPMPGVPMPGIPTRPVAPPGMPPPGAAMPPAPAPTQVPSPPEMPTGEPPLAPAPEPPFVPEGAPPTGMSTTAKIALVVLGLAAVGGVAYVATREPPRRSSPPRRPRGSTIASSVREPPRRLTSASFASPGSSLALPPPRAGRS